MKLYTEEQVREIIERAELNKHLTYGDVLDGIFPIELPSDMLCVNCDESKPTHNICMDCIIKVGKQNIELPSDEDIHNECKIGGMDTNQQLCFQLGAKWMRDKIQGGNNEQQ